MATKNHGVVHLQRVGFVLQKLYFNKAVRAKNNPNVMFPWEWVEVVM
jgi:hypothetical protein